MDDPKKDIHSNVGFSITSTPDTTEITRTLETSKVAKVQFPFRIVFVSDLVPGQRTIDWKDGKHLRQVDKNSFAQILEDLSPSIAVDVPNRLELQPRKLELTLTFTNLSDFKPIGIVRLVPQLAGLWKIREMLLSVGAGKMSMDEFKAALEELGVDRNWSAQLFDTLAGSPGVPTSSSKPTQFVNLDSDGQKSALDNIFDLVDLGSDGTEADKTAADEPNKPKAPDSLASDASPAALVDAFAAAVGAGNSVNSEGAQRIIRDIEERVSLQVQTILSHDQVRSLESSWRSLKFLIDRIDFKSNIQLDVLPVGKEDLAEALHYQVVLPEHEGRVETPASLLVFDRAFGNATSEIEAMAEIAGVAESIQTPAIASVSPGFWGCDAAEELMDLPVIWQHLQRPEYIDWNHFTESAASAHLALAMPPFLLRNAYTSSSDEKGLSIAEDQRLWGNASVAAAAVIVRRFSDSGWPTYFSGPGEHQLDELPLWNSGKGPIPVSAAYNSEKQGQLADEGFTVLACSIGKDQVHLRPAPTATRDRKYEDDDTTRKARALRNLEAQLFISRIAHFLLKEQSSFAPGVVADVAAAALQARLQSLMGISGHADAATFASVGVVAGGESAKPLLDITIQSPPSILRDPVSFRAQISMAD